MSQLSTNNTQPAGSKIIPVLADQGNQAVPPVLTPAVWPVLPVEARPVSPADLARLQEDERIAEIRRQIAAGTYLTATKLDYVIDRLFEALTAPAAAAGAA